MTDDRADTGAGSALVATPGDAGNPAAAGGDAFVVIVAAAVESVVIESTVGATL